MAKKIRVYELAKELGISNAECLAVCEKLKIGVTSHSSSMDEPQAGRVRRRAEKEGLAGGKQPAAAKPAAKSSAKAPSKKPSQAAAKSQPEKAKVATKPKATPKAKTQSESQTAAKKPEPAPKQAPKQKPAPKQESPRVPVRDTKPPPSKVRDAKPPARDAKPSPSKMPLSRSGKPIPPPPGPRRGAKTAATPGSTRRPPGFSRRGKFRPDVVLPSVDRPITGQAPKKESKGAPRAPQPYQPRRRRGGRRRRRSPIEELQPFVESEYTSEDTPVPQGKILVERGSTPEEFASQINRKGNDIIKYFLDQGEAITPSTRLSDDMIDIYALEAEVDVQIIDSDEESEAEIQKLLKADNLIGDNGASPQELLPRSPVITIMGHVDHGKTLLLDKIRSSNVAEGEKGGITQHIGAYQISHNNSTLTFIDTPGHEAFTAMRARGAKVTDIVVLVVAADDGVMPQTIEAINHAKSAGVPILVAINKVDLENKDMDKVLQQLAAQDLAPESYGGDVLVAEVSAKTGAGIEDLLEKIVLVSELEELKAVPEGRAGGVVLESELMTGRGPVATLLVKHGILSVGDPLVAGSVGGKVRALINDRGEKIDQAGPSMPVQVLGFSHIPLAGTDFLCAPSESVVRKVSEKRLELERHSVARQSSSAILGSSSSLEDVFASITSGDIATLNLILKADTSGSLEAVSDRLLALERENLKISFVHKAVGSINENDIQLGLASNGIVIGFNIRPEKKIRELAQEESVEIRTYEIIYNLLEDVESALLGMLEPEYEEIVTGEAEVRKVFHIKGVGFVAGCFVRSGKIEQGSGVRFLRDGAIIWKGKIKSLKRFTDEASEVLSGNECGIGLSDFQDLKENDLIETYESREIKVTASKSG